MIDTKELRRLAQAAMTGPDGVSLNWVKLLQDFQKEANPAVINELLDRLEDAESDGLEQARLNGVGASREATLMAKLEAAEKERESWKGLAQQFGNELDTVRAKVEQMERQEPVAWYYVTNGAWDCYSREIPPEDAYDAGSLKALYTLPSAKGE